MNILTDKLPTELIVDGEAFEIRSDFKTWIKLTQDFFLKEITAQSISEAICSVYKQIPPNPESAVYALFDFYTLNPVHKGNVSGGSRKLVFDFDIDSWLIYASFLQQYRIDLYKTDMHWWAFRNLFNTLSPETSFGKALHFRSVDIGQIKDKEQRRYYQKMKRLYALPDNRSENEKERDFADGLSGLF